MEHCKCGELCFTFTKFTQDQKFLSKRCGSFSDAKKKKKCDYREDTFICNVIFPEANKNKCINISPVKKDLRTQLDHYIHLYEISTAPGIKNGNVSANINFILKQMNYKLFFDDKEDICDLKKRIQTPPDDIKKITRFQPITLLEIPEHLKVIPKKSKQTKKSKEKVYKMPTTYLIRNTSKKHDSDSENDSDSEPREDGGFDIENYDTDEDQNDLCEDGNFSY